jgi:hypothetical protein
MKDLDAAVDAAHAAEELQPGPRDETAQATLDVPADYRRPDGVVSLDSSSHGQYVATDGRTRECSAFLRSPSWRARGEECLIVEASGHSAAKTRNLYRLVAIEPL